MCEPQPLATLRGLHGLYRENFTFTKDNMNAYVVIHLSVVKCCSENKWHSEYSRNLLQQQLLSSCGKDYGNFCKYIVMCKVVRVTKIVDSSSDDWIY
jgi:hypothetical protein